MQGKKQPKAKYPLEAILYPFPFDKDLYMPPFPSKVENPKYDKCDGKIDPQDHVREFSTLSMEFMHEKTHQMRLLPRSLTGQTMEWFTKLSPPI